MTSIIINNKMEISSKSIKDAFKKVKEDIEFLNNEILDIKIAINNIENLINKPLISKQNFNESTQLIQQTNRQKNSTDNKGSTDASMDILKIERLKTPNLSISIGNEGVPTNRQTNRQTNNPTDKIKENSLKSIDLEIKEASEMLNSLDNLKKEIRLKFKHLTSQEMLVFSTIYQFEEQKIEPTYKIISEKLGLSQSSIRDYTQRIINKGIPINKTKIDNKKIILFISQDLKKIASLSTILKLREL